MVRAFVACELSQEIQKRLAAAQAVLKKSTARLTFVDPALIHITVKFLGEVDEKKIPQMAAALKSVRVEPYTVQAGRIIVNNPSRPHTVWCVIEDAGRSQGVFSVVETVLAPLGFPREIRGFKPHATIARVKEADPSLFTYLDELKNTTGGSCMITGLKLKKSTLTPSGPVYEDLFEVLW